MKTRVTCISLFQIVLLILVAHPLTAQVILTKKGKAKASIVCEEDSSSQIAALQLQHFVQKASGTKLKFFHDRMSRMGAPIFIGKKYLPEEHRKRLEADPMDDAFLIYAAPGALYLAGKQPHGNLYAVNALLEDHLGCMRFTVDEYYVPKQKNIQIEQIDSLYSPAFSFRVPHFIGRWDRDFCNWHRVSTFDHWGRYWVHSFQKLLAPEQYFDAHPEYFALVNGRRLQDGQLCLSNPAMRNLLKENLAKEIALNPKATYWSVSQNDCYNYCECDACRAMYDRYKSISGAYIDLANDVARAFPDKQISTLAYQFTRDAPTGIKPLPNVNIMFCSIECNRSQPLETDPRSADFVRDLKNWAALSDNIFVWDYVVQFRNYLTPFPNFEVIQPNIKLFQANGGAMMFQQGSGHSWSDLSDLKQYLIAKLLWNPDLELDSVVNRFLHGYYGPAAPHIRGYYDLMHQSLRKVSQKQQLDIYGFPISYFNAHLTPELLYQYEQFMDRAEVAVQKDKTILKRVHRARLPVDFSILDISLDKQMASWPWLKSGKLNPEMLRRLDRFVECCSETGVTAINERSLTPEAYAHYVKDRVARLATPNKLDQAKVEIQTTYSPKYPVGGVAALNDRLFGGLSYHFNWLGFEGEDMVVLASFDQPTLLSSVSLNLMHAVESWIFLPNQLKVELADEQGVFQVVAELPVDNTDRHYLDRSFPFKLSFTPQSTKQIRITARSMKTCPDWHRGFGKPCWIFVDEIIVN